MSWRYNVYKYSNSNVNMTFIFKATLFCCPKGVFWQCTDDDDVVDDDDDDDDDNDDDDDGQFIFMGCQWIHERKPKWNQV